MGGILWWRVAGAAGLALAFVWAMPAAAETLPRATASVEDVRFQRYGVEDGLSQSSAMAMLQDAAGYVWIGTQDGLNRFDGYDFRVYRNDPRDPTSLPDNFVPLLEPARRGGFWVGTYAAGVARYLPERDRFVHYRASDKPGGLATDSISVFRETPDGRLWVAGNTGELQWLEPDGSRFHSTSPGVRAAVGTVSVIEPLGDDLLLGSQTGLWLLHRDGRSLRRWAEAPDAKDIQTIEFTAEGDDVWVGTRTGGLLRFDRTGRKLAHWGVAEGLPDDQVRDLQFDQAGQLWIATFDGLARLDSPDAPLRMWRFGAGLAGTLASSRIHRLMLDRDGLLWVGTWLNGFSLYVPETRSFAEIKVQQAGVRGGFGIAVTSLTVEQDGTVWLVAAENLGLIHYDLRRGVLEQYQHDAANPRSLPTRRGMHIVRDHRGQVWVGTTAGLARLQRDGFVLYRHDPQNPGSLPDDTPRRLYVDRAGALWVGTMAGGLASLCDGCTRFRRYPLLSAAEGGKGGDNAVEALFEDSRGDFWVGGVLGGLIRLDRRTGRVERFLARPGVQGYLSHGTVSVVMEDRRGRLWVGTQGGGVNLMTLDAKGQASFRSFGIPEGLPTSAVGGIVEGPEGELWISTTAGISRLDPDSGLITNYGPGAGTQVTGYFIGAYGQLPDGRIVFGGMRGATLFDPRQVLPLPSPHRVAVTGLRLLRMEQQPEVTRGLGATGGPPKGVLLPPEGDDISIEFSALSYADPEALSYAYRLEGVNDNWIEVDSRRRVASYNNLSPGHYTFHARARNPNGEWGETLSLPINLQPPWWQTGWAYLGYALMVGLVLFAVYWEVRQRIAERHRAQRRLADSEQRLKLALWGTGDELWDLDLTRDELRRQNPLDAAEISSIDLVGNVKAMRERVHPDDLERYDSAVAAHLRGDNEFIEVSYRVMDPRGGWRWLLSRGRVVARDTAGRPLRVAGANSDVTRLKEHELELARVNAELESRVQMRTEALHQTNDSLRHTIDELRDTQRQLVESEKMAALGGLVAGVAHEINTPLGVSVTAASYLESEARNLGQHLESGTLDRTGLDHFRQIAADSSQLILRNLQRADRMVRSFKQVAVDQSSEVARRIELPGYLEEVLLSLQPSLRQRRHEVTVGCPQPIALETYPGAIYQIVSNLVMNSVMHGFDGRERGHIRISISADDQQVLLQYEDDGKGMSEEARRRVFEPFFTTRRGKGGSGLGMHIAWNLATKVLGGSISCDTTRAKGVAFTLRIPRQLRRVPEPH